MKTPWFIHDFHGKNHGFRWFYFPNKTKPLLLGCSSQKCNMRITRISASHTLESTKKLWFPPEKSSWKILIESSFWNLKKSSSRKIEDEIWWNPESKNHDPSLDLDLGKTFQERSGREIPHDFKTPNCCPWSDMVNYDHPSHHGRSKHQGGKTLTIWLWLT